jgi:hypothetical protein
MPIEQNHALTELPMSYEGFMTVYLRLALGIGSLSAVADRLGWWGPPGTPNVA